MKVPRSYIACLLVLGAATTVAASEGGGGALLQPEIGTIFWTLVTFLIMVGILRRFAWKPLLGAIDAREKSIRDALQQADRDREQAEGLLKEQRDLVAEARRERAEAVELGKRDAEKVKDEILGKARAQRDQVLKQTAEQVEVGLRKARAELRATAVDLAILAAEKLLTRSLDDATQRKLVEEHLADLERQPGGSTHSPS
jgi:F-type H+-transporting ATPase subunit b